MGGGAKGGGVNFQPTQPMYTDPVTGRSYNTPDELNKQIADRESQSSAQSLLDKQTADQAALDKRNKFALGLQQAQEGATSRAQDYISSRGLNPYDPTYSQAISRAILDQSSKVPDLTDTPANFFDQNTGQSVLDNMLSAKRDKAVGALDSVFTPGYSSKWITQADINPSIDTELNNQFNPLGDQLNNALKRHMLNDTGYAAANNQLNTDRTAARSTLSSLANDILTSKRKQVDDYIGGARSNAQNLSIYNADSFDPSTYYTEAPNLVNSIRAGLGGDVHNAVSGTSFSDLPTLLNAGGVAQGATNPGPQAGLGGVGGVTEASIADQILNNKRRGIGNSGAF